MDSKTETHRSFYLVFISILIISLGPLFVESVTGNHKGEAMAVVSIAKNDLKSMVVNYNDREICNEDCTCFSNYCQDTDLMLGKMTLKSGAQTIRPDSDGKYYVSRYVLYSLMIEADNNGKEFYIESIAEPNTVYDSKGSSENQKLYSSAGNKLALINGEYSFKVEKLRTDNTYPFYFSLAEYGKAQRYIYLKSLGEKSEIVKLSFVVV